MSIECKIGIASKEFIYSSVGRSFSPFLLFSSNQNGNDDIFKWCDRLSLCLYCVWVCCVLLVNISPHFWLWNRSFITCLLTTSKLASRVKAGFSFVFLMKYKNEKRKRDVVVVVRFENLLHTQIQNKHTQSRDG